ncbi:alpha/beta hydrolase [Aquimarina sp. AD10]|uniref:alpha/beta fold hydrolase n=1 Tax=Aquimarina TaxID=290174 RepID=UPI000E48FB5D|nr:MULTISPECIES: alpha/beta hydrolase [Aquimarina]AXT59183.1 alpha/beta hydrolase [Aquimarina sp. AD10]RKM93890.1 alpha/beta fold hydrolase [Aquimarina sp. AD10]
MLTVKNKSIKEELGILFIHGAGLGKYIWNDLVANLNYSSISIEFPNRNSKDRTNSFLSLEDYVSKAISDIENYEKQKIIIITHSIGGIIGLRIAEHLKDKAIGFIAIGSAIPKNGKSFVSCLPFPQKIIIPLLMRLAGTKPPKSAIEKGLCNDLTQDQTKKIIQKFTAESRNLYTQNSNTKIPSIKKLYIKLTNDKELSISVQKRMAKNLNCENIVALESGHLPMLSVPKKLTEILNEFIDKCLTQD